MQNELQNTEKNQKVAEDLQNSFIFYRSFYENISKMKKSERLAVYEAIMEFSLNGTVIKLSGTAGIVYGLILPQLTVNKQRFMNGKKGGKRPTKPEPNPNQTDTKQDTNSEPNPNQNETESEPNKNKNYNKNKNPNYNYNLNPEEAEVCVEDSIVKSSSKKFFRIGSRIISESPAAFFRREFQVVFEEEMINSMAGARADQISIKFDQLYMFTQFDDDDHMIRAMKKLIREPYQKNGHNGHPATRKMHSETVNWGANG